MLILLCCCFWARIGKKHPPHIISSVMDNETWAGSNSKETQIHLDKQRRRMLLSSSVFLFCLFALLFNVFIEKKRIDMTNGPYNLDGFPSCSLIFPVNCKAKNNPFNWSWWRSFTWCAGSNNPTQGIIHYICFYYFFSDHLFLGGLLVAQSPQIIES